MFLGIKGFDGAEYIERQAVAIRERMTKFAGGKLYFEIGGKFLYDGHASRVLPGFDPQSKLKIFQQFRETMDILYCISAPDYVAGRMWPGYGSYREKILADLADIAKNNLPTPKIVINLYEQSDSLSDLLIHLSEDYEVFYRYPISGYPHDLKRVVSSEGYGKDDDIITKHPLVIVTAAGSNSGKMSTCLGQIYKDAQKGIDSGYAKYETFPIWNLPLHHPVNIAYEAATVDIGDRNLIDPFYEKYHHVRVVNYNRDVEAFPLIRELVRRIIRPGNAMADYHSPTDMGINQAGFCITNDRRCQKAALREIKRRQHENEALVQTGQAPQRWVKRCQELYARAAKWK